MTVNVGARSPSIFLAELAIRNKDRDLSEIVDRHIGGAELRLDVPLNKAGLFLRALWCLSLGINSICPLT
jgi:hypothetical protein